MWMNRSGRCARHSNTLAIITLGNEKRYCDAVPPALAPFAAVPMAVAPMTIERNHHTSKHLDERKERQGL